MRSLFNYVGFRLYGLRPLLRKDLLNIRSEKPFTIQSLFPVIYPEALFSVADLIRIVAFRGIFCGFSHHLGMCWAS